jgi:glycolate oxidase FAD binding subunit
MCKLFIGSLGTLGVITEATLRVAPVPESAATLLVFGGLARVMDFVERLSRSQLLPAAVVLMRSQEPEGWRVLLWCEGLAEHVARHLRDSKAMAQQLGLTTRILRDAGHRELWDEVCRFSLQLERCVYRVTVPRAELTGFLDALRATGAPLPQIVGDMAIGTLWLSWPGEERFVGLFSRVISLAAAHRGHAVLWAAPAPLKEGIDVWGPPPASFSLMRRIKQQFDPNGLLNPGRFVGGL